jgi:hypothetical protein
MTPISATIRILPAAAGTCAMCATRHEEYMAHNFQSIFYQIRFKLKYGRDATHGDTIAHLSPDEQANWRRAALPVLRQAGVEWTEPPDGDRIAEPYAESTGGR